MQRVLKMILPIIALLIGAGILAFLIAARPQAERATPEPRRTPVEVQVAATESHALLVRAQGSVVPAREVVVQPELNGRVVWQSDQLVPGGLVSAGDVLVRLDSRDFRASLEQQRAQIESGRVQVLTEERRRAVAEREWELLAREGITTSEEGRDLSMREPQLRSARATIAASEAQLRQAQLTLSRTTLRAPFSALVRERAVDVGQLVGPASRIATLVGTDHFWVQVSLPMDRVPSITIPGVNAPADAAGSHVRVFQSVGSQSIEREGRVVRLLGDLDPVGRMARVLVEIDDPLGLQHAAEDGERGMPLLLGAYVSVEIEAGDLRGIEIPRAALRDGNRVWIVENDVLAFRDVEVLWRRDATVLIRGGVSDGDAIVISPVAAAVAGTPVRIVTPGGPSVVAADPSQAPAPSAEASR